MTSPDRAASTPHGDGGSTPVAAAQPARDSRTPAVPGRPEPTVGPADPDAGGPTVHHPDDPGWAASITGNFAHYVAHDAVVTEHYDRKTGYAIDGVGAFVDELGLEMGASLPHCSKCAERLAQRVAWP